MGILRRKLRRDIRAQRGQFAAIAVTIFLGITLFGASYDAFQNLQLSYEGIFTDLRFADLTVSGSDVSGFADAARSTDEVEAVTERIVSDVPFRIGEDKLLGRVIALPPDEQPAVNRVSVLEGSYLPDGRVLVDQHLADHFELGPGEEVEALGPDGWRTLTIGGVAASPEYIWPARSRQDVFPSPNNFGVLYVPDPLARELSGLGRPNEAAVYYGPGAEADALDERLTDLAFAEGASGVLTRFEQPSNAALREDLNGFGGMSVLFPILFLTAGALATYVLLTRRVQTERTIIGTLRASGFRSRTILRHYLGFGIAAALVGTIPALVLGPLLAGLITDLYTDVLAIPSTVIELHPVTIVVGLAFGLGTGTLAAIAPARAAARLAPAEAMRAAAPVGGGRETVLERIVPPLRRLPSRWKMVVRNIGRNRRRTLYTITGVVLALTLVLVSWGMLDTTQVLLHRQFDVVQQQDAEVRFTQPVTTERLEELAGTEGVAEVEPVAQIPVSVRSADDHYESVVVALEQDTDMHRFRAAGGGFTQLPDSGVLAGSAISSKLGVDVGDEVRIAVQGTDLVYTEEIRGFIDEPLGTFLYASLDHVRELAPAGFGAPAALIRYEPGADRDDVRRRISASDDVATFTDTHALEDLVRDFMGLFYAFVGVMLAFGAMLAFALVFTQVTVNISERSTEVATLRATGVGRRTISGLLTTENLLVTLLGVVPGFVVGYAVAYGFLSTFSSDLFTYDLYVRPTTYVYAAASLIGVTLLSQWPGLRAVRRLDVARVVRERSV